jgi:hypothetical protein
LALSVLQHAGGRGVGVEEVQEREKRREAESKREKWEKEKKGKEKRGEGRGGEGRGGSSSISVFNYSYLPHLKVRHKGIVIQGFCGNPTRPKEDRFFSPALACPLNSRFTCLSGISSRCLRDASKFKACTLISTCDCVPCLPS